MTNWYAQKFNLPDNFLCRAPKQNCIKMSDSLKNETWMDEQMD